MTHPGSEAVLARLMELHPKFIDLSLDRIEALLVRLGNPERQLPPVVHVAGTNGKGSVIAMMRAALEAAGKRVHVYTSPHLVRFHERIRVAGNLIDDDELTGLLEECEMANEGQAITFFEITTVAAFLAFAREAADIVLLETGLGGRLDATNLIEKPRLTMITPVFMDHQQFLGNSLAAIAREKAGILKPDVPCILARQMPDARTAIIGRAHQVKASMIEQGQDWQVALRGADLIYDDLNGRKLFPPPGLMGPHQVGNAGLAIAALSRLCDMPVGASHIAAGLTNANWPARLQRLFSGPLVDGLADGWELWLDGGHNPAAGESVALHAKAAWTDKELHLICGMMNSKAAGDYLQPLGALAESLHAVAIPGEENSFTAEELARVAGKGAMPVPSVADAVARIIAEDEVPGRILVCGSLYLAGNVLAENT